MELHAIVGNATKSLKQRRIDDSIRFKRLASLERPKSWRAQLLELFREIFVSAVIWGAISLAIYLTSPLPFVISLVILGAIPIGAAIFEYKRR